MIVDDSEVISKRLVELLQDINGLEITSVAKDGLQALSDYNNYKPDIIILDLMIPQMNGLDVLRNIRYEDESTIIIILSNYTQTYFRDICDTLGANYFLDKSAEFDKVYQICKNQILTNLNVNTLNGEKGNDG